jgi:hypothetical protein
MSLIELASGSPAGGLPPGLIVLIVAVITVPAATGLGLVERHARHGSWPWRRGLKNFDD